MKKILSVLLALTSFCLFASNGSWSVITPFPIKAESSAAVTQVFPALPLSGGIVTGLTTFDLGIISGSLTLPTTTVNNGVFVTNGSGVGSISTTLPTGLTIPGYATTSSLSAYAQLAGAGFTGDVSIDKNAPSSTANFQLFNTASSGSASNANLSIITRQAGGGDPCLLFSLVGSPTVSYYECIDNTDDSLKFGTGTAAGANTSASIDNTTGAWTFTQPISGSITGNAGTVTTNANLSGDVTSSGNTTTYNGVVPNNKGGTGLSSFSIGSLLYAVAANTWAALTTANNALLQTSASGVPSFSTSQTYSAVLGDGTNNFTGITSNSSYYREGARTCVNIDVAWTGKGSANSGSTVRFSLPITSASTPFSNPFTLGFVNGITASSQVLAFNNGTDNYVQLVNFVSGSSATSITVGNLATSGRIQLYGCIGS